MRSRELTLRPAGLITDPSEFGEVPAGALLRLDDCVIRREGIIEPRPGFASVSSGTSLSGRIEAVVPYAGALMVWRQNTSTGARYVGVLEPNDDYNDLTGDNEHPGATWWRGRGAVARRNFYFCALEGPKKITGPTVLTPTRAGVVPVLYLSAVSVTGGLERVWTANGERAAYRACIRREDANGVVVRSAPTPRVVVENNLVAADSTVTAYFDPTQIDASCVLEVYRSEITTGIPSDELQLVVEQRLTASAASVTVTDATPETSRGAALYTNPSQGGILAANQVPPLARDLALFRGSLFYVEADEPQRITPRLIRAHGVQGTLNGDVSSGTDTILNCTGIFNLSVGMRVWETAAMTSTAATRYFPPDTYVTDITGTTVTVSANALATATGVDFEYHWNGLGAVDRQGQCTDASTSVTGLVTTTGIRVGQKVWDGSSPFAAGTNIDTDTYVASISGSGPYTVTLSKQAIGTGSTSLRFSDVLTLNGIEWAFRTDQAGTVSVANRILGHSTAYGSVEENAVERFAAHIAEYVSRWVSLNASSYEAFPWVSYQRRYYADDRMDDGEVGTLVVEERGRFGLGVVLQVNEGARSFFEPAIPSGGLVSVRKRHGVVWSEPDEPEHVRLLSYAVVGEEREPVWRAVPTRDALWLFKRDGIWRLTGTNGQWRIDPVSPTHRLLSPQCVDVMGDTIYAWTTHGLVRITDAGIEEISHPFIRKDLRDDELSLIDDGYEPVEPVDVEAVTGGGGGEVGFALSDRPAAFVVCNPKESEVILAAPGDDGADALWVWSERLRKWVGKWVSEAALSRCGCFDPSVGRVVLGHIDAHVAREKAISGPAARYDWDLAIADDVVTATTIRETYNPTTDNAANDLAANENIGVGDVIRIVDSNGDFTVHRVTDISITIVNGTTHRRTWTVTPNIAGSVVVTPANYSFLGSLKPDWLIEFSARDHRDPLTVKRWGDGSILWVAGGADYDGTFTLNFANERESWSSDQSEDHDYHANRFFVPADTARGLYQRIRVEPGTTLGLVWGIHGLSLSFRPYSSRVPL